MLNYPKYTEDDEYRALIHDGAAVYCVPLTSNTIDKVGAVCEAMGYYNYISVIPTYYEDAMGYKYSRDDTSMQVLDLLNASSFTNFGYVHPGTLSILRGMAQAQTSDFASWYAANVAKAQRIYTNLRLSHHTRQPPFLSDLRKIPALRPR